jgi:flagella basal body P-ring formation protein FlgA
LKKIIIFIPFILFADVKSKIISYYKSYYPEIKIIKIISRPSLPKHYKHIKFLFNPKTPYGNVFIDGKYYYIKIDAQIPVFKATRIIKQNSFIIENQNAIKTLIKFRYFYSKPISKIPKNLIASKIISKNAILTTSNTKIAPAVIRGESVNVVINSNNIQITSSATALQDGNIGDIIRIKLNKKIFNAIVTAKGEVTIK